MPTVYANGSANADGYLSGIPVATAQALLANIRDTLVSAGQVVDDSNIAGNVIESEGDDNGDKCYFHWEVKTVNANEKELCIRGDYDGTGSSMSPEISLPFWEGDQTRLYLSADRAGGCIMPVNGSQPSKSAHFGFPERLITDPDMWMLGYLDVWLTDTYIAEDFHDVRWREMKSYYYSGNESFTEPIGAYQNLWDSLTVAHMPYTSGFSYYSASNKFNPGYRPWYGAVDSVTGLPVLSDYGYTLGRSAYNQYVVPNYNTQSEQGISLHFPGRIRFARTGLASVPTGNQYFIPDKNIQVISGGSDKEFQGFVINAV